MKGEIIHYIRILLQTLPLFIVLFGLQIRTKKNFKKSLLFFAIIYLVNCIFEAFKVNLYSNIILTILTIVLNSIFFKKDWIDSTIDYAVFIVFIFTTSLIVEFGFATLGLFNSGENSNNNEIMMLIFMTIMVICSLLVSLFIPIKNWLEKYRGLIRTFCLIIMNIYIFYFISTEDFIANSSRNIFIIGLSYLAIILLNVFLFKEFWNTKNKEQMLQQHTEFIKNFDSIISDIHSKQHEFKNHITTLNNLCFTDKDTYDEIATSYINSINTDISNIDYLTTSYNKIIGSILYSKSCACNLKGIKFTYENKDQKISFPLESYELTSVIANLIDNAIEAIENSHISNTLNKQIIFKTGQTDKEKYLQVSNTGDPISFEMSQKIFSKGYTTKKNYISHGYGLYNLKKIILKYKGNINVINNNPYVTFRVSFIK